jgi:uncharacterized protein (DUF58 family)
MTGAAAPLAPEPVMAAARNRGRVAFGFAPRFFIALLVGLIWLIPLWWSPRFLPLLLIWNGLALAAWIADLVQLPPAKALSVTRTWAGPLILGRPVRVTISIRQLTRKFLRTWFIDELSPTLYGELPQFQFFLLPAQASVHEYEIVPRRRGNTIVGAVYFGYRSRFGFAERWAVAPVSQTVCVLPDMTEANQQAMFLIRSRQADVQKRRHRDPGLGREFEALREYRQGDDVRDVCWPATARRHTLVTRTFSAERSQTVWVVIDCGRLLRAEIEQPGRDYRFSKLDFSVDASLSIAQVAAQYGDNVGAVAYGRSIQQLLKPRRGSAHLRHWIDALAHVHSEATEANHGLAARALLQHQTRRALVVWITDFAETPSTPDVVEYAAQIAKRHLVLFAVVSQPDLAEAAHRVPETEQEMFRGAAALALLQRREVLLRTLRQQGVLAIEVAPGRLSTVLVNQYLAIKDRNLL